MLYPYVCYLAARNVNMVHIDTWVKMNSSTAPKKSVLLTSTSSLGGCSQALPVIDIYVFHRDLCAQRSATHLTTNYGLRPGPETDRRLVGADGLGCGGIRSVGRLGKDSIDSEKPDTSRRSTGGTPVDDEHSWKKTRRQLGVFFLKGRLVVMKMKPPFFGRKKRPRDFTRSSLFWNLRCWRMDHEWRYTPRVLIG